jgi:hypothetical protein
MKKLRLFPVNLQQGFLLEEGSDEIIAAYSNWSKDSIWKVPSKPEDYKLPEQVFKYENIVRLTDSFSISMFTMRKGDVSITLSDSAKAFLGVDGYQETY